LSGIQGEGRKSGVTKRGGKKREDIACLKALRIPTGGGKIGSEKEKIKGSTCRRRVLTVLKKVKSRDHRMRDVPVQ